MRVYELLLWQDYVRVRPCQYPELACMVHRVVNDLCDEE